LVMDKEEDVSPSCDFSVYYSAFHIDGEDDLVCSQEYNCTRPLGFCENPLACDEHRILCLKARQHVHQLFCRRVSIARFNSCLEENTRGDFCDHAHRCPCHALREWFASVELLGRALLQWYEQMYTRPVATAMLMRGSLDSLKQPGKDIFNPNADRCLIEILAGILCEIMMAVEDHPSGVGG